MAGRMKLILETEIDPEIGSARIEIIADDTELRSWLELEAGQDPGEVIRDRLQPPGAALAAVLQAMERE